MIALIIADPHLADRPPSIRTETYTDDMLAKIEFTVDAYGHSVDAVVFAGDVFHVKAPTRTSHALVQRMAKLVKAYGCPVFIVPGNHDMQNDRLDSLERQPLGVLFEAGARQAVGPAAEGLFGVPWLGDFPSELPEYMRDWQNGEEGLMVAHAPIVQPGSTKPYDFIDAYDWAEQMGRAGDVYFGHMHDPDGVFEVPVELVSSTFCNNGALSRGSIHESTLKRKPAVTLYDSSKRGLSVFERIEVPHKPAAEVFRLQEKALEEVKVSRLEEFLSGVEHTELSGLSIEAVISHVEGLGLEPDVLREIRECLEVAS